MKANMVEEPYESKEFGYIEKVELTTALKDIKIKINRTRCK